ncbi:hypothetical protein pipiens_008975 [Culex pipiens pipiens]|uniref:Uncharacterized protein n=1 Tax=Culex pipiens pipiens TaxID=38569 RepID=A0ABD1DFP9_CULPP
MPKMKNLKVLSLIEFDTFVATHGPGKYVEELAGSKRKLSALSEEPSKQQKFLYLAYFNPVLAHVVAMSDEKLPFVALDSSRWSAGGNERHFVGAETVDLPQPKAPLVPVSFNGFASRSKHGSRVGQDSEGLDGWSTCQNRGLSSQLRSVQLLLIRSRLREREVSEPRRVPPLRWKRLMLLPEATLLLSQRFRRWLRPEKAADAAA